MSAVAKPARAYKPPPGTLPFRVIEWLHTQARGSKHSSAAIAEALNLDSTAGFRATFQPAIDHGVLVVEKRLGERNLYWSLGDGTPPQRDVPPEELGDHDEPLRIAPKPGCTPVASVFHLAGGTATLAAPEQPHIAVGNEARLDDAHEHFAREHIDAPTGDLRIALWSDGVLELKRAGSALIALSAAETKQLLHYLERLSTEDGQ